MSNLTSSIYEPFLGSLADIITPKESLTFLVGAGISMDPPSKVPSAREFGRALLEYCAPPEEVENLLKLTGLRYEMIVQHIQNWFDFDLKFLDYFNQSMAPNFIHHFLAKAIAEKMFVLTTNFDYQIERALKILISTDKHQYILPIITKNDFKQNSEPEMIIRLGNYPLYKVHGSKYNIITNEDTTSSLITTLTALGKDREQGETFAIEPFKKPAVMALAKDRILVVMGYSGQDDFDLGPMLRELPELKGVVWIEHTKDNPIIIEKVCKSKILESKPALNGIDLILSEMAQNIDGNVIRIRGSTADLLKKHISPLLFPLKNEIKVDSFQNSQYLSFKDWVAPIFQNIPNTKKYTMAVWEFYYLGQIEDALRCALKGLEEAKIEQNEKSQGDFNSWLGIIYKSSGKFDLAVTYFTEALRFAEKLDDLTNKSIDLNNLGSIYDSQGDYKTAIKYYSEAFEVAEKLGKLSEKGVALNNLGNVYENQGDYDMAMKYYSESLQISEKLGQLDGKATQLNNIASIYKLSGDLDKALSNYNESFQIAQQLGDLNGKAVCLNNIGTIYRKQGKFDLAAKNYSDALQIHEKMGDLEGKAIALNNLGLIYDTKEDYDLAEKYYTDALLIAEQLGDLAGKSRRLNNLGSIFKARKNYDTAVKCYSDAINIADEIGAQDIKATYLNNLGSVYDEKGDYDNAIKYYTDALHIVEKTGNLANKAIRLNNLGMVHHSKGNIDIAEKYITEAIAIAEQIDDLQNKTKFENNLKSIKKVVN